MTLRSRISYKYWKPTNFLNMMWKILKHLKDTSINVRQKISVFHHHHQGLRSKNTLETLVKYSISDGYNIMFITQHFLTRTHSFPEEEDFKY